jgi:uncharacterized protein YbbK (DUF523 family)
MRILVSACLLGVACRYDGKSVPKDCVKELMNEHELIPFCPEIYGGLKTPRDPSEIIGDKVMSINGVDVTEQYMKGAYEALNMCKLFGCKVAVLKEKSPSCGFGRIYDGTFSGTLTDGDGVTAKLLTENGIAVYGENSIDKIKP